MSNLTEHARRELEIAGFFDSDSDYGGMLGDAVMELVEKFAEQGHSGFSANQTTNLFDKLSRFEPLKPLTGKDGEWNEVGDGLYQNNRCSHVFKENGRAYDSRGRVFRGKDGLTYTSRGSRVNIKFPYTPKTRIVKGE